MSVVGRGFSRDVYRCRYECGRVELELVYGMWKIVELLVNVGQEERNS